MNQGNGGIVSVVDLWSVNGVLRGVDKAVQDGNVFGGFMTSAGAGGYTAAVRLSNPGASGIVMLVDGLTCLAGVGQTLTVVLDATSSWANSANGYNYNVGESASVGVLENNTAVVSGTPVMGGMQMTAVDMVFDITTPFLLSAGQAITVYGGTNAVTIQAIYKWREYTV